MSKPVKNLIIKHYKDRFANVDDVVLVDIRGVASNDNNKLRHTLAQKAIRVTVVQNNLARNAFANTSLANIGELLEGPSALVYGGASVVEVAREVLDIVKNISALQVKGALMDGQLFKAEEVEALSKYPTRAEAQAQVLQIVLTPAQKLVGSILGPGRKVASLVKAIEEKLEKGEAIAAVV